MNNTIKMGLKALLAFLSGIAVFIGIYIYGIVSNAYVVKLLWEWYIVPTFNLSPLLMGQAFGLSILVGFLSHQHVDVEAPERDSKESIVFAIGVLSQPWIVLLTGYIGWHIFF